ncbi:hypothetical protein A2U01_0113906, partial [Trifolium medium]|nr:hypothetical protein [Trifolium medium]
MQEGKASWREQHDGWWEVGIIINLKA